MELHALERRAARTEAHAHDLVLPRLRRDLERVGHRVGRDDERVVARRDERVLHAGVDALLVVEDLRGLAVHDARRAHDAAAEHLTDALVTEADAEDRNLAGEPMDDIHRDAGFVRRARTRRDRDRVGRLRGDRLERDGVVALDGDVGTQLAEILREVVGERVVVVDQEELHDPSRAVRAIATARSTPRALLTVSSYSISGTESATRPAPACT